MLKSQSDPINILVELEILRMKIHYKIFKMLKETIKKENLFLEVKESQQLILRYILNKNADLNLKSQSDPVYILGDSELAKNQLLLDIKYFKFPLKMYKKIKDLLEESFIFANEFIEEQKKNNTVPLDKEIKIKFFKHPILTYENDTLAKITDNNIKIYDNKIEIAYYSKNKENILDLNKIKYTFCSLLRYKYLYLDAHGSQLEYRNSIENFAELNLDEATECFASPFNHTFNHYCSAFLDIEKPLGSLGNFFTITKFPTKLLLVNPVFDPVFIKLTINHILNIMKISKHIVYFILPIWRHVSYNTLYESEFFIKKKIFPKGELFFYNFPTGRRYSPCDIEIIMLDNN